MIFNRFGKLISYCHSLSALDYISRRLNSSVSVCNVDLLLRLLICTRQISFAWLSNKTVKCQIDSIISEQISKCYAGKKKKELKSHICVMLLLSLWKKSIGTKLIIFNFFFFCWFVILTFCHSHLIRTLEMPEVETIMSLNHFPSKNYASGNTTDQYRWCR